MKLEETDMRGSIPWGQCAFVYIDVIYGFETVGSYIMHSRKTYLWSIDKNRWLDKSPLLPQSFGIEEGCLTLLNRTTVLIMGVTKLECNVNWIKY